MISRLRSLLMASGAIEAYRPLGVEEDLDRYDQPDSTLTLAEASALAALELTGGNTCASNKSGFSSVTPSTPLRSPEPHGA
jgi:hypothetical protein